MVSSNLSLRIGSELLAGLLSES